MDCTAVQSWTSSSGKVSAISGIVFDVILYIPRTRDIQREGRELGNKIFSLVSYRNCDADTSQLLKLIGHWFQVCLSQTVGMAIYR